MDNIFSRLIGQFPSKQLLLNAALSIRGCYKSKKIENIPFSWLITGPFGSDPSLAALCFAATLLCTSKTNPGCNMCNECKTIIEKTNIAVHHIAAEGLHITINEICQIIHKSSLKHTEKHCQVVIIDDINYLTEVSINVLLKILEEPPLSTIFLLSASASNDIDIAISLRSRCCHVVLNTPPKEEITNLLMLENKNLKKAEAKWAAENSLGCINIAKQLINNSKVRKQRKITFRLLQDVSVLSHAFISVEKILFLVEESVSEINLNLSKIETEKLKKVFGISKTKQIPAVPNRLMALALKNLEKKQKLRQSRLYLNHLDFLLLNLVGYLRDILILSSGVDENININNPDMKETIKSIANIVPPSRLLSCIEIVLLCQSNIFNGVKPKLAINAMIISIGNELNNFN